MTRPREPIDPGRVRALPREGFSWLDRRFVRDGWCKALAPEASHLYFFLAAVSDARGLSFYSDRAVAERLHLDRESLVQARSRLIQLGLLLYRAPLYQVLPIPPGGPPPCRTRPYATRRLCPSDSPVTLGEVLREALRRERDRRVDPPR